MSMSKKLTDIVEQAKSYIPDSTDDLAPSRAIVWSVIGVCAFIAIVAIVWSLFN
jgi:hypothetical protein